VGHLHTFLSPTGSAKGKVLTEAGGNSNPSRQFASFE